MVATSGVFDDVHRKRPNEKHRLSVYNEQNISPYDGLPPEKESSYNVSKKGGQMGRKTCTPEQIINRLREAEIHINQGIPIAEASRKIGVTEQTYYRWRKEYGGLRIEQAKKLKNLEKENVRLKKLVADLSLDNEILKEAAEGNF